MKKIIIIITLFLALFLLGCAQENDKGNTGIANPASVYCEKQGYNLEITKDANGNEYGICKFSDGTECEEWDYFRGNCKPGDTEIAVSVNEEQCKSMGGEWGRFGMAPILQCNLPTKDGGKSCTDGSQCEAGLCTAESETAASGKCPEWKLNFGCLTVLQEGKLLGLCID